MILTNVQISPRDIALPVSPVPSSVSLSVSVSTPRGDIPSIRDSLLTIPSESSHAAPSPGPSHILTHDVNVLLRHLHELEETRGPQIREILENVRTIRDNVFELMEERERESREVVVERIHEYLMTLGEDVRAGKIKLDEFIIFKVSRA